MMCPGLGALVGEHDDLEELERHGEDEEEPEPARHAPARSRARSARRCEPRGHLVEQDEQRDARDRRREQEDDRHERRRPPGVRLDAAEDEADVAVEHAGGGEADARSGSSRRGGRSRAPRARCRRSRAPGRRRSARFSPRLRRAVSMISLRKTNQTSSDQDHQVAAVEDAEPGHGRGEVRRDHDVEAARGWPRWSWQRQRRHEQEAEGGRQGEARRPARTPCGRRGGRAR